MSGSVWWILELEVKPGRDNDFTGLVEEMVGATRQNEPGTLNYEWSTSADGRICHIFERYVDSAAVSAHLATFGEKFADRFLELLKPVRFVVYGSPSDEVKEALKGFNPIYMSAAGGFSR